VAIGQTPESHLRPLTGLSPAQQRDAWARAQEQAGPAPVSASHVEAAAREVAALDTGIDDVRKRARALNLRVERKDDAFLLQSNDSRPMQIYRFTCGADGARHMQSEIEAISRLNNDLMTIEQAALDAAISDVPRTDPDASLTDEELNDLSRIGGWNPDGKGGPHHCTSPKGLPMVRLMTTQGSEEGDPYVETRTPGGWRILLARLREQDAIRERARERERHGIAPHAPDAAIPADWNDWQFAARRLGAELRMSHLGVITLVANDSIIGRGSNRRGWPEICAAITAREPAIAPDGWRWREGRSGPDYWQAERISDGLISPCKYSIAEVRAAVERIRSLGRIAHSEAYLADRAQQLGGTFTTLKKGKNAPAFSVLIPPDLMPRLFSFKRDEDGEGYDIPSALVALDQAREYLAVAIEHNTAPISAPPTHTEISASPDNAFWIDDDDGRAIYVRDTGLPPLTAEAIAEVSNGLRLLCLGQAYAVDAELLFELSRAIGGTANPARNTLAGVLSLVGEDAEEHAARRAE
jgi:hypothetical protein